MHIKRKTDKAGTKMKLALPSITHLCLREIVCVCVRERERELVSVLAHGGKRLHIYVYISTQTTLAAGNFFFSFELVTIT